MFILICVICVLLLIVVRTLLKIVFELIVISKQIEAANGDVFRRLQEIENSIDNVAQRM